MYTKEQIEKAVKSKGYVWFNGLNEKGYDVNIVGVRNNSPSTFKKVTNVFDDFITLTFKDENGVVQYYCWSATTDPGKKVSKIFKIVKELLDQFPVNIEEYILYLYMEVNIRLFVRDQVMLLYGEIKIEIWFMMKQ